MNIYPLNSGMMGKVTWAPSSSLGGLLQFGRPNTDNFNIIEVGTSTDPEVQMLLDVVQWGWTAGHGMVYQPPVGSVLSKLLELGLAKIEYERFIYPLVCVCHRCGGPQSLYIRNKTVDPELLSAKACREVQLAGWAFTAKKWSNSPPTGEYCQCDEQWKNAAFPIEPVMDTGWEVASSSIPSRGIRDYTRIISFSRSLSTEELSQVKGYLQLDPKCPGWTGISVQGLLDYDYRFSTTWDSSD